MTTNPATPMAHELLIDVRHVIAEEKAWVSPGEMAWVDSGGRPRGWTFREPLLIGASQPMNLFVKCYYKPSTRPGWPDKLSMSLMYRGYRVHGIDEDGPGGHYNDVGSGRKFFRQRIGFPHVHYPIDEAIYGYAEPIDRQELPRLWHRFLSEAHISGAPELILPTVQLGLPV